MTDKYIETKIDELALAVTHGENGDFVKNRSYIAIKIRGLINQIKKEKDDEFKTIIKNIRAVGIDDGGRTEFIKMVILNSLKKKIIKF